MIDRGLRRLAWVMFALGVVFTVSRIVLDHLNGGVRSSLEASPIEAPIYLTFPIVGAVLAMRRPRLPFGWMMLAIGFFFVSPAPAYARFATVTREGLPGAELALAVETPMWVVFVGLSAFMVLLFPDGHLPSPRWRWPARIAAVGFVVLYLVTLVGPSQGAEYGLPGLENPFLVEPVAHAGWLSGLAFAVVPISLVGATVAMILRIRRATEPVQLQQLRLLTWSAGVIAVLYVCALVPVAFGLGAAWENALGVVAAMSFTLIPIAIGIAVLRYRLYDIDVVINKAIVYGAMAVFITAVYVAIAVGIGALIGSGGESSIGLSVLATACVAIAFQPVRERVQHVANRLVYGRRAAPYDVLADLSGRMAGSFETEDLLPRIARLLADGTGARRAEVWLRVGDALWLEVGYPDRSDIAPPLPVVAGALPQIPEASRVVEVRDRDELLGALALQKAPGEPLTPPEERLVADFARQAALVLRNVRLIEELRASRERIVAAQDDERRRLERDIHDGAQQQIVTLSLATRLAQSTLGPDAPPALTDMLERAVGELKEALAELRELARGIHPRILTERGLGAAVRFLAERSPVPVEVDVRTNGELSDTIEATAYFAVSEALANVAKYADATSARITAEQMDHSLVVRVEDDGVGGADPSGGTGLRGLVDRVAAVGGELLVDSPPGRGTRLTVRLPAGER